MIIERFILSLKNECTRTIVVPLRMDAFQLELTYFTQWYNHSRPHSSLNGKTPHEVYHDLLPACERPRFEPRVRWPRSAPCAAPPALVAGHCALPFGVIREEPGNAGVWIALSEGKERHILFEKGTPVANNSAAILSFEKKAFVYKVQVGDEQYEIPEAVVFSG